MLGVSVDVIQNRIERLSRSALGILSFLQPLLKSKENFCADGFESFSRSQFFPNNINILVGSESEYLYAIGLSILRRKGKMTKAQKRKRKLLEETAVADSRSTKRSMKMLFDVLLKLIAQKEQIEARLYTDEHHCYPEAFNEVRGLSRCMHHSRISSKELRARSNPLFPVNYCDRQFRKDLSDHVRETVQFARCPSAMMSRLTVYQLFHNCIIPHRVRQYRKGTQTTRAEIAGANRELILDNLSKGMMRRVFRSKIELDDQANKTWFMAWRNPGISMKRYVPKYIYD